MRHRQLIVAVLCLATALAVPRTALAIWDKPQCLPGIDCKPVRTLLVIGAIAAASALVAFKLLGRDKPDGLRALKTQLEFDRGAAHAELAFVNASTTPVRVLSIALRQGDAFQLGPGLSMPVELAPQQPLRVDVLFSPHASGSYQDEVIVATRGSAAEKVRLVKVRVRAAASESIPAPTLAGASR